MLTGAGLRSRESGRTAPSAIAAGQMTRKSRGLSAGRCVMNVNRVIHGDALDVLRGLPDASVDAIITDPPYGQGLADWDKPVDALAFLREVYRIAANDSFLAFFHQLPQALDWLIAAPQAGWNFKEHVVWLKRIMGGAGSGLVRTHESLFIYRKGRAAYVDTTGPYADVKIPGVLDGAIMADSLYRMMSSLQYEIKHGKKEIIQRKVEEHGHAAHHARFTRTPGEKYTDTVNFTNTWSFLPQNGAPSKVIDHPSVKPLDLMERSVRLLTEPNGLVLDPFVGSGTTLVAARNLQRRYLGVELNAEYVAIAERRLAEMYTLPMFETVAADTAAD